MSNIVLKFDFFGEKIEIESTRNEVFKNIIQTFCSKVNKRKERLMFLYNGNIVDETKKLEEFNIVDNQMPIIVESLEFPEEIQCPTCGENCIINISNYKVTLNECGKGHCFENLLIDEIYNTLNYDSSKGNYYCEKHPNQRYITYCKTCYKNFCDLCEEYDEHRDQKHDIVIFGKTFKLNNRIDKFESFKKID